MPHIFSQTLYKMHNPRFYIARRDTRWDVYPQQEPNQVIAFDFNGYWEFSKECGWFKTPASFNFVREISFDEAEAMTKAVPTADAVRSPVVPR